MSSETSDRGFVVVTGTSTGVGAATALHLAGQGFHVFAGVRREADADALLAQAGEQLTPLIIEVTDEATIPAAAAAVADAVGERVWPASSTTRASACRRPSSSSRWPTFGGSWRSTSSGRSR